MLCKEPTNRAPEFLLGSVFSCSVLCTCKFGHTCFPRTCISQQKGGSIISSMRPHLDSLQSPFSWWTSRNFLAGKTQTCRGSWWHMSILESLEKQVQKFNYSFKWNELKRSLTFRNIQDVLLFLPESEKLKDSLDLKCQVVRLGSRSPCSAGFYLSPGTASSSRIDLDVPTKWPRWWL